jgi:uncharacterized protein YggL (DUF469 family)
MAIEEDREHCLNEFQQFGLRLHISYISNVDRDSVTEQTTLNAAD